MAGVFALGLMSAIVTAFIIYLHTKSGEKWLKGMDE